MQAADQSGEHDADGFRSPTPGELSVVVYADAMDRWIQLRTTLRGVLQQRATVREVLLVVDDNDHLVAAARAVFPVVTVLPNSAEPGAAGSRQTGAAQAGGPVVAFLDDTVVVTPDWSQLVVEGFDSPDVLAVGGRIGRPRPRPATSWWPPAIDGVTACVHRGLPMGPDVLAAMTGANLTLRADVLAEPDAVAGRCLRAQRRPGLTPGGTTWQYRAVSCDDAAHRQDTLTAQAG